MDGLGDIGVRGDECVCVCGCVWMCVNGRIGI